MHSGSEHLAYIIIYLVVISWKGTILANGDDPTTGDTTVDKLIVNSVNRSQFLNVTNDVLNGTGANSASSTTYLNLSNAKISINSLSIGGCSGSNIVENKIPIDNIRDDYTQIQDVGIYKLHKRKLSWYGAYKACVDENAHLVVINSLKEANALTQIMKSMDIYYAYIGAHDMFLEGEWITVHGESMEKAGYDQWVPGEPNNAAGNENCAILINHGLMNDFPCGHETYYICELPL